MNLLALIEAHNAKMQKECLEWACYEERERGERCPNCPMDHSIDVPASTPQSHTGEKNG